MEARPITADKKSETARRAAIGVLVWGVLPLLAVLAERVKPTFAR